MRCRYHVTTFLEKISPDATTLLTTWVEVEHAGTWSNVPTQEKQTVDNKFEIVDCNVNRYFEVGSLCNL